MGGDGGVIASNRRYMRGAGSAECTADRSRYQKADGPAADVTRELMTTCALTKAPLEFGTQAIVACPYGFLYHKEAAVQALLRRREAAKQQQTAGGTSSEEDELGQHIRGLKDLYPVHFHLVQQQDANTATTSKEESSTSINPKHQTQRLVPACPVTGTELNGTMRALLLLSTEKSKDEDKVNVISERALKEMGMEALQAEYGPFDANRMIRLAPLPSMMEQLQEELQQQRELELANKKKNNGTKKKSKKRHADDALVATTSTLSTTSSRKQAKLHTTDTKTEQAAQVARDRASSAMQKNQVLSSLFTPKSRA